MAESEGRAIEPVRLGDELAADGDQVGIAGGEDVFRLPRLQDRADRHRRQARLPAHRGGIRHLVAGVILADDKVAGPDMPPEEQSSKSMPRAFNACASATVSSIVTPPSMPSIDDVR